MSLDDYNDGGTSSGEDVILGYIEELQGQVSELTDRVDEIDVEGEISQLTETLQGLEDSFTTSFEGRVKTLEAKYRAEVESLNSTLAKVEDRTSKSTATFEVKQKIAKQDLDNSLAKLEEARGSASKLLQDFRDEMVGEQKSLKEIIAKVKKELTDDLTKKFSALSHGGGNANRQIRVEGVDVLTKYTDINIVGVNSSVLVSTDSTNKRINIRIPNGGALSLTATADFWIDGNRTDSYSETGSIGTPFKTISAAITAINLLSYGAYCIRLTPATYVEGAPLTFPNSPLIIMGNGSTLVVPSGMTLQKAFDIYDLSIIGNVIQSDTSLTTVHAFESGFNQGNITLSGLVFFNTSATDTSGILTINAGAICVVNNSSIFNRIINSGTLYFNGSNMTRNDNSNYLIDSTAAGSLAYISNSKFVNSGTGGGLNLSNTATATVPNEASAIDVIVGGTTNGITCGSAGVILSDYNIFGSGGQFYATGTNMKSAARFGIEFANNSGSVLTMQPSSTLGNWNFILPDNAGSANQALTTDGTGITRWASVAGVGGSGIVRSTSIISVSSTIAAAAATDYVIFANVGIITTLPTAIGNTNRYTIKNYVASSVLIATSAGQSIDDSATALLTAKYQSLDLMSNGSIWGVI